MTTDRDDIASLLAKVTAATGPSHELDRLITEITGYPNVYRNEDGSIPFTAIVANFTGSVDAALALVERLLPGWMVEHIGADAVGAPMAMKTIGWTVELGSGHHLALDGPQGQAATLPIAILAALLTSLKENHP